MTGINVKKNKSKIRGYALSKLLLFCALIVAIGSCKKDGDTGPQGVAGPTGTSYNYKQGGFIQGNITGNRSDGTPFAISFNNKYYHILDNFSYDEFNFIYNFSVERHPSSDPLVSGYCLFNFSLSSLSSTIPVDSRFFGYFFKDLGNGQTFELNVNAYSNTSNTVVTNLSYNSATHITQGNFSILVDPGDNSTGNSATVSGSFQSIAVTEYVSRINPETETSHLVRY